MYNIIIMKDKKVVGILYICTGKYNQFWEEFYISSEKYLLPNIKKQYFVFTDNENLSFKNNNNIYINNILDEGFPTVSLKRFEYFTKNTKQYKDVDILLYLNSNVVFTKEIQLSEIDPKEQNLIAFVHPGADITSYEKNKESTAFITKPNKHYFMGGALGGKTKEFIKVSENIKNGIKKDSKNNILAIYHDESHWNKELSTRSDYIIIKRGILMPEEDENTKKAKGIFLSKSVLGYKKYSFTGKVLGFLYKKVKNTRTYKVYKKLKL